MKQNVDQHFQKHFEFYIALAICECVCVVHIILTSVLPYTVCDTVLKVGETY